MLVCTQDAAHLFTLEYRINRGSVNNQGAGIVRNDNNRGLVQSGGDSEQGIVFSNLLLNRVSSFSNGALERVHNFQMTSLFIGRYLGICKFFFIFVPLYSVINWKKLLPHRVRIYLVQRRILAHYGSSPRKCHPKQSSSWTVLAAFTRIRMGFVSCAQRRSHLTFVFFTASINFASSERQFLLL